MYCLSFPTCTTPRRQCIKEQGGGGWQGPPRVDISNHHLCLHTCGHHSVEQPEVSYLKRHCTAGPAYWSSQKTCLRAAAVMMHVGDPKLQVGCMLGGATASNMHRISGQGGNITQRTSSFVPWLQAQLGSGCMHCIGSLQACDECVPCHGIQPDQQPRICRWVDHASCSIRPHQAVPPRLTSPQSCAPKVGCAPGALSCAAAAARRSRPCTNIPAVTCRRAKQIICTNAGIECTSTCVHNLLGTRP